MKNEIVGNYRIEAKLGEGGVGEVFRALDPELGRSVALKRLRPELASRPDVVERFRTEAKTLAQLNHPNIATLYSFHAIDDDLFMVMEFVEGETLSSLLRRSGGLPVGAAVSIFEQALDGLGYAHEQGVIHRDIKGSNLILSRDGIVKLMDFGIARVVGAERVTLLGQLLGTPEYMSPEQIRGEEIDHRSDIYSLGALFYALLCGEPPFRGASDFELMQAQLEEPPPSLVERIPTIPPELDAAILRALEKDPALRFSNTLEFRQVLLGLLPEEPNSLPIQRPIPIALGAGATLAVSGTGVRLDDEAQTVLDGPRTPLPEESATHTLVCPEAPPRRRRAFWGLTGLLAALAAAAGLNWLGFENLPGVEEVRRALAQEPPEPLPTAPPSGDGSAPNAPLPGPNVASAQKPQAQPAEETRRGEVGRSPTPSAPAHPPVARPRVRRSEEKGEETPAGWNIRRQ